MLEANKKLISWYSSEGYCLFIFLCCGLPMESESHGIYFFANLFGYSL